MAKKSIRILNFTKVYPLYVAKAERKGRTKKEVDEIIRWLTGYSQKKELEMQVKKQATLRKAFSRKPLSSILTVFDHGRCLRRRVEDIEEPLMKEIRTLDKLIDELAKGRAIEKILRR